MSRDLVYTNSNHYKCLEDLKGTSSELCLIYCGFEQCEKGHKHEVIKRKNFLLHIVKSGKGKLNIYNKKYSLKGGDAFLIPPGTPAVYEADLEDPWTYMWVGFIGMKAMEYTEIIGFREQEFVVHTENVDYIQELIDKILDARQLSFECELKRNAYLMLILAELSKRYDSGGQYHEYYYSGATYVKYAMDYIYENIDQRLRITDLANEIGVNRSYLTNMFKAVTGYSPKQLITNLRMEKAKDLLSNSDLSISNVAEQVGYPDVLAFSKIFKQNFNVSPKKYREDKGSLRVCTQKGEHIDRNLYE